jgi:hypothetical protein
LLKKLRLAAKTFEYFVIQPVGEREYLIFVANGYYSHSQIVLFNTRNLYIYISLLSHRSYFTEFVKYDQSFNTYNFTGIYVVSNLLFIVNFFIK